MRVDLTIVRGLAYYTGLVFELFDRKGEFRAICGGGRYDHLLRDLGGVDLPALGFGMGDVVLGELLRSRGRMPDTRARPDLWVACAEPRFHRQAVAVAARLRRAGAAVEYALRPQPLAKQMKAAAGVGVSRVVIVGYGGVPSDSVLVKTMSDGSQETTTLEAMLSAWQEATRSPARP